MLRVVTADEMKQIEALAIAAGITEEALMEQAGKQIDALVADFVEKNSLATKAYILAGKGKNGGDAYVVARLLLRRGFTVQVLQVFPTEPGSLNKKQRRQFEVRNGKVTDLSKDLPPFPQEGVIIDGLFGSGFHGQVEDQALAVIKAANQTGLPIISIDIPSGLDVSTGEVKAAAINATITAAIEFPKMGFFLGSGYNFIGTVQHLSIGLGPYAEGIPASLHIIEKADVQPLMPKALRNRNKYSAGHVTGLAGSHGMAGAALLSSFAAMRSGAGIVHLLHPEECSPEFSGHPLEIVRVPYHKEDTNIIRQWIDRAGACFIGPGLGLSTFTEALLGTLWNNWKDKKIVVDADALVYITRINEAHSGSLPQAVFTPHFGEMQRMLNRGEKELSFSLLLACQKFVDTYQTHLLLKGGPTFLFSYNQPILMILGGDPGMATAGSGDVLTGIISSFMAQGLTSQSAMHLGAFMHALAGELAAQEETSFCMTASSIIAKLPAAFKQLLH